MVALVFVSTLAAIVAVIAAIIAILPIVERYWRLYCIPRRALLMHRALLSMHRGQLVFSDPRGESVRPMKLWSIYVRLWWDYRLVCKYDIESSSEMMGRTICLFERNHQRYVPTQELEKYSLNPNQFLPSPPTLDYTLAKEWGLEYGSLINNEIYTTFEKEDGSASITMPRERSAAEVEETIETMRAWLSSYGEDILPSVVEAKCGQVPQSYEEAAEISREQEEYFRSLTDDDSTENNQGVISMPQTEDERLAFANADPNLPPYTLVIAETIARVGGTVYIRLTHGSLKDVVIGIDDACAAPLSKEDAEILASDWNIGIPG